MDLQECLELQPSRFVFWWSHGSTSTHSVNIGIPALRAAGYEGVIEIVCIMLADEHKDNFRVAKEYGGYFEKNHGIKMKFLTNEKYKNYQGYGSVDEVIRQEKYMAGVAGARCTKELKKKVRLDYQKPGDCHVFGFHSEEAHREDQILDTEPDLLIYTPLIERGLNKQDALDAVAKMGFRIPVMYELGYNNNNCLGCLKATAPGYWNKIRKDFPQVFEKRAYQSRMLNVALVKISFRTLATKHRDDFAELIRSYIKGDIKEIRVDGKGSDSKTNHVVTLSDGTVVNTYKLLNEEPELALYELDKFKNSKGGGVRLRLDQLPPDAGDFKTEHSFECGIFCEMK